MSNSSDLLGGLIGLGMAGLVGYSAYAQQQQEENQLRDVREKIGKMDSAIDQMIDDPQQAVSVIRDCIVDMDETTWTVFSGLLASKIDNKPAAKMILAMAHYTREAAKEVKQLIGHSVDEAVSMINDIWSQEDEAEQTGFVLALQGKAQSSVRAKAILGRLAT